MSQINTDNNNLENSSSKNLFKKIDLQKFGAFIGLISLCLFFSFSTENFFTVNNLITVSLQTSIIAIVAIGQTFTIIKAGIDLSVGSIVAMSGVVAGQLMAMGYPIILTIIVGIAIGTLCGLVNGMLISYGSIPPFIATLGMMGIVRGIVLVLTDGVPVSGLPSEFGVIGGERLLGIPIPTIIMVLLAILMSIVLRKTRFGRSVYAIGSNEDASYLSGIKVNRTKIGVYALSGLMSSIGGIILASRLVSAQPTAGQMYELDAIAAAVIGGASLMGGAGTILGTLIGAFIMGVLKNGLNLMSISYFWQQIAIGVVVIVAVYIDILRNKIKS